MIHLNTRSCYAALTELAFGMGGNLPQLGLWVFGRQTSIAVRDANGPWQGQRNRQQKALESTLRRRTILIQIYTSSHSTQPAKKGTGSHVPQDQCLIHEQQFESLKNMSGAALLRCLPLKKSS